MAKQISTTKKGDVPAPTSIFEHFGLEDKPKTPAEKPEGDKKPVDVDALVARLDRLESDNQTLQQSNLALMSTPRQTYTAPAAPAVAPAPGIMEGLPDPVSDPDNYGKELERRIAGRIDSALTQQSTTHSEQQKSSGRIEALWGEFADHPKYKDYAGNVDQVEFAATKVAKRAEAKGLNLDQYMFTTSEAFFSDIAVEMDKTFPKAEPDDKKKADDKDKGEEEERTSGIFGGVESGGKPGEDPKAEAGDMLEDLTSLQRKSEYF